MEITREEFKSLQEQLRQNYQLLRELRELSYPLNDLRVLAARLLHTGDFELQTDHRVAFESPDHLIPFGTAQDNTRSPRFVLACERQFSTRPALKMLDLGCSGGGLVFDFLLRGHRAFGIEGSDLSQKMGRAEWRVIGANLATADLTKPFEIKDKELGARASFDVISLWEVFEHIAVTDFPTVFTNILNHLARDGLFIGSINTLPEPPYHQSVFPRGKWVEYFEYFGLKMLDQHHFGPYDFARGVAGGRFDSNDYNVYPERGFHFVACLAE